MSNSLGKDTVKLKSCPFAAEFEWKNFQPALLENHIKVDKINKLLISGNKKISYMNHFNYENKLTNYCRNKNLSKIIFNKYNIPYPKYELLSNVKNNNIINFNFPLILKPIKGSRGQGMVGDIKDIKNLNERIISINPDNYIIQEQKKGKTYRILILNNKIIYVKESLPPFIKGNNADSISILIKKLNDQLKKKNKDFYVKRISYNYIREQGFDKDSIPPNNKKIFITNVINLGNGAQDYNYIPISDIHPVNLELFLKVSKIFKLNFCGIDYITNDLTTPYYFSDGNVLEVNTKPGFVGILENNPSFFLNTLFNK